MGDPPSAVSLTFCCCRFRCRDKSHKETRRVTNEHRSSERRIHGAAAHCRLQYDELRRRRMGRARERGGSNYSPIPPSPASGLLPQNSFCGMDTQVGGRARVVARRIVGWLVLVAALPSSILIRGRTTTAAAAAASVATKHNENGSPFLRPPLQPELFSGRAVRACLDPRERATRSTRREE